MGTKQTWKQGLLHWSQVTLQQSRNEGRPTNREIERRFEEYAQMRQSEAQEMTWKEVSPQVAKKNGRFTIGPFTTALFMSFV